MRKPLVTSHGWIRCFTMSIEPWLAGMHVLGFQRGAINGIKVRRLASLGLKRPTCELELDVRQIRRALTAPLRPDSIMETWIHESAHARISPWARDFRSEQSHWLGYEEGLAEGLTSVIVRLGALSSNIGAYVRYRRGFELLAEAIGVPAEDLYRRLWVHEPGSVRRAFTDVVNDLYHLTRGRMLTLQERRDLQDQADVVFDTAVEHVSGRTIERAMRNAWRTVLP